MQFLPYDPRITPELPANSPARPLESPVHLLRILPAERLHNLPSGVPMHAPGLKPRDESVLAFRAPPHPRDNPLLGKTPVVE